MAKKSKKDQIEPGTSLQEMDIASPGGNLESYINSIHNIGILTSEQKGSWQKICIIEMI